MATTTVVITTSQTLLKSQRKVLRTNLRLSHRMPSLPQMPSQLQMVRLHLQMPSLLTTRLQLKVLSLRTRSQQMARTNQNLMLKEETKEVTTSPSKMLNLLLPMEHPSHHLHLTLPPLQLHLQLLKHQLKHLPLRLLSKMLNYQLVIHLHLLLLQLNNLLRSQLSPLPLPHLSNSRSRMPTVTGLPT